MENNYLLLVRFFLIVGKNATLGFIFVIKEEECVYFAFFCLKEQTISLFSTRSMTIVQLEYVVAVDICKSFAKAAKTCYVTQPTLSMQIKKLEEELGILLFDRSKKPVMTTDIGRKIIDQAKLSLLEFRKIKDVIREETDEIKGTLRLGIIPTLSPYLLPLFITDFIKKYPQVNLIVEELMSERIVAKLDNDALDLGILVTPLKEKKLVETPLFYESFVVYMSTNHPLTNRNELDFSDLDINDMWLLKEGHCFRNQAINICADQLLKESKNQLKFESGSLETLKRIVESQYGYTLLPELAVMHMSEVKNKYIKKFKEPEPVREVSIVVHRSFLKKRLITLFKEEILSHLPMALQVQGERKLVEWT